MYNNKSVLLGSCALFAAIFGAGNLIFPPLIGYQTGTSWIMAAIGFWLSAVLLPAISFISSSKVKGNIDVLWTRVSPLFAKIFSSIIILIVGPLLTVPRTGATAFEVGITPMLQNYTNLQQLLFKLAFMFSYFALTLAFVLRPRKVIEIVGKIISPVLIVFLLGILLVGMLNPLGVPTLGSGSIEAFHTGFFTGYQTMDAIGCLLIVNILLVFARTHGASNNGEELSFNFKIAIIAFIAVGCVYTGLLYLGATANNTLPFTNTTSLLVGIVQQLLGKSGIFILTIGVIGACLTTAISFTAVFSQYYQNLLHCSYIKVAIGCNVMSFIIAMFGVDMIIAFAAPILTICYPVIIALALLCLVDKYIPANATFIGTTIGAGLTGILEAATQIFSHTTWIQQIYGYLPLANFGLAWTVPAILGGIIATSITFHTTTAQVK